MMASCVYQARVYTTEENERIQKKERQEAIMAQFKAKYDLSWTITDAFLDYLRSML